MRLKQLNLKSMPRASKIRKGLRGSKVGREWPWWIKGPAVRSARES